MLSPAPVRYAPQAPSAPTLDSKEEERDAPRADPFSFVRKKPEPSAPPPPTSTTAEADELRAENERLKAALADVRAKLAKCDGVPSSFLQALESSLANANSPPKFRKQESIHQTISELLRQGGMNASLGEKKDGTKNSTVFICAAPEEGPEKGDGGEEAMVCVMDVNDDEWWQLIDPEPKELAPTKAPPPFDSDDSYEIVEQKDVKEAISDFVTKNVSKRFRQVKELSDQELKRMVDCTFKGLEEKGTLTKLWEWGQFAYTTYGWGSYALALYREPMYVQMVAGGAYTVAKWVFMLVL